MNAISYISLGTGLLSIVVGWLCYRFANMINPYGGMSPERKALVDIEGLKWSLAIIMTVVGGLLLLTALLGFLKVLDEGLSGFFLTVIGIGMIIPLFIAMRRHNGFGRDRSGTLPRDKQWGKSAKTALWINVGAVAIVIIIFALINRTPKIEVGEETVSISGIYGREIPVSEIVSVELLEAMPPIAQRINGGSTMRCDKGHYRLKNGEKCMMFIRNQAPYIELRTTDNLYYFNSDSEEKTLQILSEIKEITHLKP